MNAFKTIALGVCLAPAAFAASPQSAEPTPRQFTSSDLGFYAKSADLATLDPEHPVNARLRNQGIGFVPKVIETDLAGKTALLGVSAIQALIRVALGWHVNDDGRRALILDPGGKVQISLHLIQKEGRSAGQILDALQAEAVQSYPHPEFRRVTKDRVSTLAVQNIAVDKEPIEQVHMVTAWENDSAVLRARVTADPASMRWASDYTALLLKSVEYRHRQQGEGPARGTKK